MYTDVIKELQVSDQNKLLNNAVILLPDFSIEAYFAETKWTKNVRHFWDIFTICSLFTFGNISEISIEISLLTCFGFFRFEKILAELESHVDERIACGSYDHLKMHLVPFVQKLLGEKDYSERLILTAAAILDNNCFEINMQLRGVEMGGLFLLSLILSHDCVPNTKHFVNFIESDSDINCYQMTFQTTGEEDLKCMLKFSQLFHLFLL
jgi:hypothetical protein